MKKTNSSSSSSNSSGSSKKSPKTKTKSNRIKRSSADASLEKLRLKSSPPTSPSKQATLQSPSYAKIETPASSDSKFKNKLAARGRIHKRRKTPRFPSLPDLGAVGGLSSQKESFSSSSSSSEGGSETPKRKFLVVGIPKPKLSGSDDDDVKPGPSRPHSSLLFTEKKRQRTPPPVAPKPVKRVVQSSPPVATQPPVEEWDWQEDDVFEEDACALPLTDLQKDALRATCMKRAMKQKTMKRGPEVDYKRPQPPLFRVMYPHSPEVMCQDYQRLKTEVLKEWYRVDGLVRRFPADDYVSSRRALRNRVDFSIRQAGGHLEMLYYYIFDQSLHDVVTAVNGYFKLLLDFLLTQMQREYENRAAVQYMNRVIHYLIHKRNAKWDIEQTFTIPTDNLHEPRNYMEFHALLMNAFTWTDELLSAFRDVIAIALAPLQRLLAGDLVGSMPQYYNPRSEAGVKCQELRIHPCERTETEILEEMCVSEKEIRAAVNARLAN